MLRVTIIESGSMTTITIGMTKGRLKISLKEAICRVN